MPDDRKIWCRLIQFPLYIIPSIFMNNQEKLTILKISSLCILILASENHSKNTYFDQQSSLSLMYTLLFRRFDSSQEAKFSCPDESFVS